MTKLRLATLRTGTIKSSAILDVIAGRYEMLSLAHRRIAENIISDPIGAAGQSISELASRAGVSIATVTRFCGAIGVSGYPALRKNLIDMLAQANKKAESHRSVMPLLLCNTDQSISHELADVLRLTANARNLMLAGLGPAALLCKYVATYFAGRLRNCMVVGFEGARIAARYLEACDTRDVLILFENDDDPPGDAAFQSLACAKGVTVFSARHIQWMMSDGDLPLSVGEQAGGHQAVDASLSAAKGVYRLLDWVVLKKKNESISREM
jgi:hypothetical protein